jgi:hypothetical protein
MYSLNQDCPRSIDEKTIKFRRLPFFTFSQRTICNKTAKDSNPTNPKKNDKMASSTTEATEDVVHMLAAARNSLHIFDEDNEGGDEESFMKRYVDATIRLQHVMVPIVHSSVSVSIFIRSSEIAMTLEAEIRKHQEGRIEAEFANYVKLRPGVKFYIQSVEEYGTDCLPPLPGTSIVVVVDPVVIHIQHLQTLAKDRECPIFVFAQDPDTFRATDQLVLHHNAIRHSTPYDCERKKVVESVLRELGWVEDVAALVMQASHGLKKVVVVFFCFTLKQPIFQPRWSSPKQRRLERMSSHIHTCLHQKGIVINILLACNRQHLRKTPSFQDQNGCFQ